MKTPINTMVHRQGVALVQVLLILTLLSLVATNIQISQRQNLDRSVSVLMQGQAREYLLGAETMGSELLYADATINTQQGSDLNNTEFDDLNNQLWNVPLGPVLIAQGRETELEQGMVLAMVTDLNRRFNLNWLSDEASDPDTMKTNFARLLSALEIDTSFADTLRNWFHEDSGAEYIYTNKEPPYFPSVMPMSDISELLLLDGMTRDIYDKLKDYVCALPVDMKLNINTASAEVLQTISSSWTADTAENIISARDSSPFMSVDDMFDDVDFSEDEEKGVDESLLTINSDYFLIHAEVDLQDRLGRLSVPFYIQSVLYRNSSDEIQLVSRDLSVTPITDPGATETSLDQATN